MTAAWLEIVAGADLGKQIVLGEQEQHLGRGGSSDIALSDGKISRLHASIRFQNGSFILRDLNSGNGTFVNGVRVQETLLSSGARIQLGDTVLVFNLGEPDSPEHSHATETRVCSYCESNIPSEMTHCIACGAAVTAEVDEKSISPAPVKILSSPEPTPDEDSQKPPIIGAGNSDRVPNDKRQKPSRKFLIILGILISCCCIVVVTFICLMSSGSDYETYVAPTADTVVDLPEISSEDDWESPPSIHSEEYLEGQEAEDFALETMYRRDADIGDTLRYAEELGFITMEDDEILAAGRVILDNGMVIDMFLAGADPAPEESVFFLQVGDSVDEFEQAVTYFLRIEGDEQDPKLALYYPGVNVIITGDELEIGADSNDGMIKSSFSQSGLMSINLQEKCRTTELDEYTGCVERRVWSGWGAGCSSALIAVGASLAKAAAAAGGSLGAVTPLVFVTDVFPSVVGAVITCGPIAYDVSYACWIEAIDNPPVAKITSPFSKIEGSYREKCFNEQSGSQKIYEQIYRVDIEWSDDREPFDAAGVQTYQGLWEEISAITVRDCAGQDVTVNPMPETFDINESWSGVDCAENETCTFDGVHANCVPASEPEPDEEEPAPPPEPAPVVPDWPYATSFSGRYTGVLQKRSGEWACSTTDSHWYNVTFTYQLNEDGSISWVGVIADGEERQIDKPKVYQRVDDSTFYLKTEDQNGTWETTLKFSAKNLEISNKKTSTDGSSGTCVITLDADKK